MSVLFKVNIETRKPILNESFSGRVRDELLN